MNVPQSSWLHLVYGEVRADVVPGNGLPVRPGQAEEWPIETSICSTASTYFP